MSTPTPPLFEAGQQALLALRAELAACGVRLDPRLELRQRNGLLCHYDLDDGHIYLAAPDPETGRGRFTLLLLRSLVRFDSNDEILRFLELLIPWLVAHEAGHHLRHRYGRFGPPLAEEERIASQLALAFVRRYLTIDQQTEIRRTLARGIAHLAAGLPAAGGADEAHPGRGLIHHVYRHMQRFYEGLLTPEAPSIADFVQSYLEL